MRSALVVITGIFAVSLATTPAVGAQDRQEPAAAPPAPRQAAVPRSEPRQMPSPASAGAERAAARSMAREMPAPRMRESAPSRLVVPRSEPVQVPTPAPARVGVAAFGASGSGAVNEAREQRARGRSAPRDSSSGGGGRAQAAPRGERRAPDSGREQGAPRAERRAPDSAREQPASSPRGERRATRDEGSGNAPAAAPRAARPRDGRYPVGQATTRTGPVYGGGGGYYSRPSWYYRPSAFYGYGALGLGYFYYDPFWGGYSGYGYSPYGYGYSPYGGYYGGGYYGGGLGGGAYGGGYYGSSTGGGYYGTGHLRLKVKPRDAEVYVDGYYAGLVDDFDGVFQKLELDAGPHRIEVRKAGFATMAFDVRIPPDEGVTYRGELNQLP